MKKGKQASYFDLLQLQLLIQLTVLSKYTQTLAGWWEGLETVVIYNKIYLAVDKCSYCRLIPWSQMHMVWLKTAARNHVTRKPQIVVW